MHHDRLSTPYVVLRILGASKASDLIIGHAETNPSGFGRVSSELVCEGQAIHGIATCMAIWQIGHAAGCPRGRLPLLSFSPFLQLGKISMIDRSLPSAA
jgi:hypothetical protein